jgi:hypothetical protein
LVTQRISRALPDALSCGGSNIRSERQRMITTREIRPGVVEVTIVAAAYGQAGLHWRKVLSGANHNGYGRIYIQRQGANARRYQSCYELRDYYRGERGANLDECPGAMFIWSGPKSAHVEALDAIDNQKLGRELGHALRGYPQQTPQDLWEVVFRFA